MKKETQGLIWFVVAIAFVFSMVAGGIWFAVNVLQYEMEQAAQADNATSEIPWEDIGRGSFQ